MTREVTGRTPRRVTGWSGDWLIDWRHAQRAPIKTLLLKMHTKPLKNVSSKETMIFAKSKTHILMSPFLRVTLPKTSTTNSSLRDSFESRWRCRHSFTIFFLVTRISLKKNRCTTFTYWHNCVPSESRVSADLSDVHLRSKLPPLRSFQLLLAGTILRRDSKRSLQTEKGENSSKMCKFSLLSMFRTVWHVW